MGVVIQEMVDADAAGVLFTVNPNDGDPSKMILTANYGLGESVVSASADPDTFYVKRTSSGELSISERTVGAKRSKIVLTNDGTREEIVGEETSVSFCLSDEKVIEIGQLGVYLEKAFGGPRDLEFAVSQGLVHLLQVFSFCKFVSHFSSTQFVMCLGKTSYRTRFLDGFRTPSRIRLSYTFRFRLHDESQHW